MFLRKLILLLCCWFCFSALVAQDSLTPKNHILAEYGLHHLASQDLIFSPFILKDLTALNLGVQYKRDAEFIHLAELYFDSFDPVYLSAFDYYSVPDSQKLRALKNDFTHVKVNYGFGKKWKTAEKYSLQCGIMSENTIHAQYYYAGYFSNFGYFASFGLSAWSHFEYRLNEKNAFNAAVYFPLVAWVARSPYLANDDEFIQNISSHNGVKTFFAYLADGSLQSLNTLQQLGLKLNYIYTLNQRWDIGASWHFNFMHNKTPLNLINYQNAFNINSTFHF